MKLIFDRELVISIGTNRKDMNWKSAKTAVGDLWERLKSPVRGVETMAAYLSMPKGKQDELKDVGGFVGGALKGGRRKAEAVLGRDIVTLDFDTVPPYGTDSLIARAAEMGFAFAAYSTRKHREEAPRLRVLFPLARTVSADEYEPVARYLAAQIGIQMADQTTFEPSRLMYWPSCCADSKYIFRYEDMPLAEPDGILGEYDDWKDYRSWPQVPGAEAIYKKLAVKQGDPDAKPGVVGAFNRAYGDVFTVMEKLLPGIYEPVTNDPNRFTYLGGSTTGGAVVYDNGKFLYSHHATDPCSGKLVNCFDLARLHKFGDEDDNAQPGTPVTKLKSYNLMVKYATQEDALCMKQMSREWGSAESDFAPENETPGGDGDNWMDGLKRHPKTGNPLPTIDNILMILDNDPRVQGAFALNAFAGRGEILRPLPWDESGKRRLWNDTDNNGLYWFMEKNYFIDKRNNVDAAMDIHATRHAFNDVQDYIEGLEWDGTPRLDTLFIDYLGAEDDEAGYCRAVARKSFTAAVARAMNPGCKYDQMVILCGPQGIGKSTLLDKMSRGWFNDSIRTFEGKEAAELLPGVWIVEVAELDAFRKTDVSRIKQFLSLRADRYRAAYGRNAKEQPRACVFFGTCNQSDFLQDTTGNRRFWPVDVGKQKRTKSVWDDLTEAAVDQIWAEARIRWQVGEELFLTGKADQMALIKQELHRDSSPWEGIIHEFVTREIPKDWLKWNINQRRDYWAQEGQRGNYELVRRDRVSVIEVWCELLGGSKRDIKPSDKREIAACLAKAEGWKRAESPFYGGLPYGTQRGYVIM